MSTDPCDLCKANVGTIWWEGHWACASCADHCPRCESTDPRFCYEPCDPENGGLTQHAWHRAAQPVSQEDPQ